MKKAKLRELLKTIRQSESFKEVKALKEAKPKKKEVTK